MRPQQQNRRMRGRGGNRGGGKGPNPLTRSYESNGPDVKIRGTAQQVADKYSTLARDAQSSGDRVIAENYLQHAEHYNRIIAAAQAQQQQQQQQNSRDNRDDDYDDDERDDRDYASSGNDGNNGNNGRNNSDNKDQQQRSSADDGTGPQPVIEGTPAEVALKQQNSRDNSNGSHAGRANGSGEETAAFSGEAAEGEEQQAKPRRARRPRKPRSDDRGESAQSADGDESPRGEPAEAESAQG